jgi:hypothetical protein
VLCAQPNFVAAHPKEQRRFVDVPSSRKSALSMPLYAETEELIGGNIVPYGPWVFFYYKSFLDAFHYRHSNRCGAVSAVILTQIYELVRMRASG